MKTIGLLGGMSWESTQSYYRLLNEGVRDALGGLHSARLALFSVDFAEIERLQHLGDWAATAEILSAAAQSVQAAGADFLLICTNTMHKVAPQIQAQLSIPILHLADATALALKQDGIQRVGLLGTRFTMEQSFYRDRLVAQGIEVLTPDDAGRDQVHRIIYQELCQGQILVSSRERYCDQVAALVAEGAEAMVLGCTEIGLLLRPQDVATPLYDTTVIHAREAVSVALGRSPLPDFVV
ncbi:aspartate/glutamate racemase family protein [Marinobacter sp. CA1]|uniref:aspartate/glutamate racemase family protein n=1 Tax=Marinobacter sp. CA1 TaxID=2817656 RepID=UPI001D0675D4|nr:aspartate/glutamate racemase family protein [Marinobacter sp. CA1]UDL06763.1 aspartate/glutamate racemase family protein [Marinobacter sp. CA1]